MRKHTLVRNVVLLFLCISGIGMGSCKKTVNQVVNQVFSKYYTIPASAWIVNSTSTYIYVDINVPQLDQIILANGGVLVYLSLDGGKNFETVPEVYGNVAYGTYHSLNTVGIDLTPANNKGVVSAPTGPVDVKIVLLDAQPL
jgi:hypothetical protein